MAICQGPLLGHISGKYGATSFRRYWGKTVIITIPFVNKRRMTVKQKAHQKRFEEATLKARLILHNKAQRKEWKKKCPHGRSLFNFLVKEMMRES